MTTFLQTISFIQSRLSDNIPGERPARITHSRLPSSPGRFNSLVHHRLWLGSCSEKCAALLHLGKIPVTVSQRSEEEPRGCGRVAIVVHSGVKGVLVEGTKIDY
jgi:hypothetical protein